MIADAEHRLAWERLTQLLDDDALLWPRVREALEKGDADPWEALLDGLDDAGALAYLDAEDTGMELADALAQLPRVFRLRLDLGAVSDTDDLHEAMASAGRSLAGGGWRLLLMPDGDAHALLVVRDGDVPDIVKLSARLGRSVTAFG